MSRNGKPIDLYLEVGTKRVFAGAIEWPGWCRSGRDERSALGALMDYGPRYAGVLRAQTMRFAPPRTAERLWVVDRLPGNATTDFGAPGMVPTADQRPIDRRWLTRSLRVLEACWKAFDGSVRAATGKELTKGPRGGGRDLDKIVRHVMEADWAYLAQIGAKRDLRPDGDPKAELRRLRSAIQDALVQSVGTEPVRRGPRGGVRWPPRYFVRRSAWHILDHAWEIQDRAIEPARAARPRR
jgi:hypothetical protein